MIARSIQILALCLIAALAVSCSIEDDVVLDVATIQLVVLDEQLQPQTLDNTASTIQAAMVTVDSALLTGLEQDVDLTFGGSTGDDQCRFLDSSLIGPAPLGRCASGVVVDGDDQLRPITLTLTFELEVYRGKPAALPDLEDFDGDGVQNGGDNCPLIDNPAQRDNNLDGVGDGCSRTDLVTGSGVADNDLDGVVDTFDNCPAVTNPGQEDTNLLSTGMNTPGLPDGIGDACETQVAAVTDKATTLSTIAVQLPPLDLMLGRNQQILLAVDLNSEISLDCDWTLGTPACEIDTNQIVACLTTSSFTGCP